MKPEEREAQKDIENSPLLKYCLYYDGSESRERNLWGYYEKHWIDELRTNAQAFQEEVEYMIRCGISEEWIDSFEIPRSLVGIFFNRYCHWLGLYDINHFMEWFEEIRSEKSNK